MTRGATMNHLGVIGGGAWGTALGSVFVRAGRDTLLWAREPEVVDEINSGHENSLFLRGIALPEGLRASGDLADFADMEALFLVTPAQHMRATAEALRPHLRRRMPLVICAKGIERESGKLMSTVLAETLPGHPLAVLSGPTFATEVARGLPAALTLATAEELLGRALMAAIARPTFRTYFSPDPVGAQIGGAVKNVLAIACGVVAGLRLGENARAALITRGLAEMTRFGEAMGARRETLMGLSGVGDLILTCSSEQSRNMSLGKALGEGRRAADVLAERRSVAEGVWSAEVVARLGREHGIEMPITDAVVALLAPDARVGAVVEGLLARPLKAEEP
ncbi:MAG: NAD(P)H-dependent glycerol-3-phosphate dehydrogenase [Rhodothalassiaceae bacterium]